jgi:WD40 repeat protein
LPGGARMISLLGNEPVHIWHAETCSLLGELQADIAANTIIWSFDGSLISNAHGSHHALRVWNTMTFEMVAELERGAGFGSSFVCTAFSPDNRHIVSGMRDGAVLVWSIVDSEVIAEFTGSGGRTECVAYSPGGSHFAAGSENTLRVWDAATYEELYISSMEAGSLPDLDFSHDGKHLMAMFYAKNSRGTVCIVLKVDTFQVVARFESDVYRPGVFTADGRGVLLKEVQDTTSAWMPSQAKNSTCEFPAWWSTVSDNLCSCLDRGSALDSEPSYKRDQLQRQCLVGRYSSYLESWLASMLGGFDSQTDLAALRPKELG